MKTSCVLVKQGSEGETWVTRRGIFPASALGFVNPFKEALRLRGVTGYVH
ncbi:MAG: hypothetical protein WAR24_18280 [Candidatus Acidiferrales bacterium]